MKQVRSDFKKLAVLLSKENRAFENKLEKDGSKKGIHFALRRGDVLGDTISDLGGGWLESITGPGGW